MVRQTARRREWREQRERGGNSKWNGPPLPKKRGLPSEAITKCPLQLSSHTHTHTPTYIHTLYTLCNSSTRCNLEKAATRQCMCVGMYMSVCVCMRVVQWACLFANFTPHIDNICSSGANALNREKERERERGQGPSGQGTQQAFPPSSSSSPPRRSAVLVRLS